jgi:hypothetical protein
VLDEEIDDATGTTEFSGSIAAFEVDALLERYRVFIKICFKNE